MTDSRRLFILDVNGNAEGEGRASFAAIYSTSAGRFATIAIAREDTDSRLAHYRFGLGTVLQIDYVLDRHFVAEPLRALLTGPGLLRVRRFSV